MRQTHIGAYSRPLKGKRHYPHFVDYFGDGHKFGVSIEYVIEQQPLGSGGGLFFLKDKVKTDFLVCSGDTVLDVDVERMYRYHLEHQAQITMFTHPNAHPYDSDLVVTDANNRVTGIDKKGGIRDYCYHNNVNASFVIADNSTLQYFDELRKINLEHDFITHFIGLGSVYAYNSSEYIKDVGTPDPKPTQRVYPFGRRNRTVGRRGGSSQIT